jgi:D-alanyl-D-alanine carboxypeptidase/D-alanyl-D-alanine-endopeptidase (penicillin-binding protein 4)
MRENSTNRRFFKSAGNQLVQSPVLQTAHVGISVYYPLTGKYLFNYQADKYFVPASNTKLPTCYAAMKYLGDSLTGLQVTEYQDDIFLSGTGDPTLLHPDFKEQPVYNYLKGLEAEKKSLWFSTGKRWQEKGLGTGWSWSDYDADYMAERSALPVFGNVVRFSGRFDSITIIPSFFTGYTDAHASIPGGYISRVVRQLGSNQFNSYSYGKKFNTIAVPFVTSDSLNFLLLQDSLHSTKTIASPSSAPPVMKNNTVVRSYKVHSQPTDSLLKPMMHNSDNFFAEQALLMVSNEKLGLMSDAKIIDTLLKTDLADLPQKPRWVDGCGLSRMDLFSPEDMVTILDKMSREFGMQRIKNILPTGDEGTLEGLYKAERGYIYAKTGTLTGVIALSGFLFTKNKKLLIFSILVNNHTGAAADVRSAIEKFVEEMRNKL